MEPYIGEVRLFAGTFAPKGWAFCDGSQLSVALSDALFSLIGTTYGGDGSEYFNLPDLRGRVPIHQGTLSGFAGFSYSPGDSGGAEKLPLTADQIPAHTHALTVTTVPGTAATPALNLIATPPDSFKMFRETSGSTAFNAGAVSTFGMGTAHNNMQPFVAINYIIAVDGLWPPQG